MPVSIRNRWSNDVIATVEDTDSVRDAVIRLVRQGVSLRSANLRGSNLSGSDLRGSNLSGSNLAPVRDDFFAVLSQAPAEVPELIAALDAGRVNGSTYSDGECGCLVGTLAIAGGADPHNEKQCQVIHGLTANASRPAERFFLAIKKGDTPEKSQFARLARDWAGEWLARMQKAFGIREAADAADESALVRNRRPSSNAGGPRWRKR